MDEDLRVRMQECILNHGHIMIGYSVVEDLLKYIESLEHTKNILNDKINELYNLINAKDQIINEQINNK